MAEVFNFGEERKKKNIPGENFSRQDIYDFLVKINLVDLEWGEFDDLSIFTRKTKKGEVRKIAGIDFGDYSSGQGFLPVNFYDKDFERLIESLCGRLVNRFDFGFYMCGRY